MVTLLRPGPDSPADASLPSGGSESERMAKAVSMARETAGPTRPLHGAPGLVGRLIIRFHGHVEDTMRMNRPRGTVVATIVLAMAGLTVPATAAAPVAGPDATFLKMIHQGNLAEIATAKDAQKHTTSTCVKQTADMFVRDHTKFDAQVMALARSKGVTLPSTAAATQQKQLTMLKSLHGRPDYKPVWLQGQDTSHRQALALIDKEVSSGKDSKIRATARAARPTVAKHLQAVNGGICHTVKGATDTRT
ncbi:DUF4142 domain-containing protein [Streptomyces yunnanensis]|uniref:DUF4142 domain-containing protein n=1 Tax=Streptomyces yunnanensis TaxID=156453 RepID=A0ABY8A177_9ACTN|nr:DUF4142 domain-containing protein [Streptomyces yunnanensis]WEB38694.1 DUF4142 domain-containing protein [Streptomyces yunnanensis]